MVNRLAASSPELDAGVPYYGRQVPADQVPNIKAPLMLHYAEKDDGVNAGIAAYEAALKANNKKYTLHMYPGTQHAFFNDTRRRPLQQGSGRLSGSARWRSSRSSSARRRTRPERRGLSAANIGMTQEPRGHDGRIVIVAASLGLCIT